jgi:hypothetical protein
MNEYVVRVFSETGNIRSLTCVTSNLVDQASRRTRHRTAVAIRVRHSLLVATLRIVRQLRSATRCQDHLRQEPNS